MKAPADAYKTVLALGVKKACQPASKILLLGVMAGLQVGIGAAMAVATLGGVPLMQEQNPALAKLLFGIAGLPCSLLMVMATGAELFTGNTAVVGTAFFEGKISLQQLLKSWSCSYAGNLIGGGLLALLCNYAGVFSQAAGTFTAVADAKAALPFGVAVARGIICNWLVCTAVWVSTAAADLVSKAVATLMIITIFASLGFEHSIANMFVGPFGAMQKTSRTGFVAFFVKNLVQRSPFSSFVSLVNSLRFFSQSTALPFPLRSFRTSSHLNRRVSPITLRDPTQVPVTIGNILGGSFLMAGMQHLAFGGRDKTSATTTPVNKRE